MGSQRGSSTIDRDTAEALLTGRLTPAEATPPYDRVAKVLAAAAAPADPREASPDRATVGRLAAAAVARETSPGRSFRLSFRHKIAVLGMALFLVLTGSLAAAGALPDGAQRVAHNVLEKVGIHVPGPNPRAGNHPFERGKSGKPKKVVPGQNGKNKSNPVFQPSPTGGP